jgi:hypothetical protein
LWENEGPKINTKSDILFQINENDMENKPFFIFRQLERPEKSKAVVGNSVSSQCLKDIWS